MLSAHELSPEVEALASRFIKAVEAADFGTIRDEIYTPETVIWHNTSGVGIGPEENIRRLTWLLSVAADFRYEEVRRQPVPGGYLQQHTLRFRVIPLDHQPVEVRACFIVRVREGRIVHLEEYLDSAASAILDPLRPKY